ncbi:MAG: hypothetical protein LBU27_00815 [Candidatus Peribacteria bacterium]|jgi:hypothetical protein|nr:hypothetical protein [Candidatus Peribacteria bacterium]
MDKDRINQILIETGGDCFYADMFIEAAAEAAASMDCIIDKKYIDFYYDEVERYRKRREKRVMSNES